MKAFLLTTLLLLLCNVGIVVVADSNREQTNQNLTPNSSKVNMETSYSGVIVPQSNCNFMVGISNAYIDESQNGKELVYLSASTAPLLEPEAVYDWTVEYEDGTTHSEVVFSSKVPIPYTSTNKIVKAKVAISYQGCTQTSQRTFQPAIPNLVNGYGF